MTFDRAAIEDHVRLLHGRAGGCDGVLTLTAIYDGKAAHTERFAIGAVDRMVEAIAGFQKHPAVNLYAPWVVWRPGLPVGKKGAEADIVAVLAAVADLDGDKGVSCEPPAEASYIVETSPGNSQAFYIFPRPLTVGEAKPALCALADAVGGDSATRDCSHVWRIPGTLNIPTRSKLARGRSPEPVPVFIRKAANGHLVDAADLLALAPAPKAQKAKGKTANVPPLSAAAEAKLRDALAVVPADDRDIWLRVGMALHMHGAAQIWDEWSKTSKKYDQTEQTKTWNSFNADRNERVSIASVFAMARERGWKKTHSNGTAPTEDDLATALVERHELERRFVSVWGDWFEWHCGRWRPEKTLSTFNLTRKICRNLKEPVK